MTQDPTPLTDAELSEMERRVDAATQGQGVYGFRHARTDITQLIAEVKRLREAMTAIKRTASLMIGDLPALSREIDQLRDEVERLRRLVNPALECAKLYRRYHESQSMDFIGPTVAGDEAWDQFATALEKLEQKGECGR